jgi:hypothetical protein
MHAGLQIPISYQTAPTTLLLHSSLWKSYQAMPPSIKSQRLAVSTSPIIFLHYSPHIGNYDCASSLIIISLNLFHRLFRYYNFAHFKLSWLEILWAYYRMISRGFLDAQPTSLARATPA